MTRLLALLVGLVSTVSVAGPLDRVLLLDVGVGWPQLAGAEASIFLTPQWYAGLTFGILPGVNNVFPQQTMPTQSAVLPDGNRYYVQPTVKSTYYSISPFMRFFLSKDRPVYLQFMCSAFTTISNITGPLRDNGGAEVPGTAVNGRVILAQLLPTVSLGHIWASKFYFFNLSLGVSFLANIVTNTTAEILLPFPIDTSEAEQMIADSVARSADEASRQIRQNMFLLPSIWLSFGLIL